MKRAVSSVFVIFTLGIIAGAIFYYNFGNSNGDPKSFNDTLLVDNAFASEQREQRNDDLYKSRQNSITTAVEKLSPAVVGINVMQVRELRRKSPFSTRDPFLREFFPEFFQDQRYRQEIQALGSGFIISSDGYILTNEHVVENATEVIVTMTDGSKEKAEIVGTDPTSDVALLKIARNNLVYVVMGNANEIILGEWAIAIGNPFGLFEINNRATVTVGVISALNRDFGEIKGRVYQDMIQTDASINHGNSGGPLCNSLGEVIGMNAFIYSEKENEGSVGIGFAIPINRVTRLIDDLKKYHTIDRDFWIGIRVKSIDQAISQKLGYTKNGGVMVSYIDRKSPSEKAGIKLGDIIIQIGNETIFSDEDVTAAIYEEDYRVNDMMAVKVWRDGKVIDLNILLESIRKN
ncbi:MAG: trypsin-like serine protease [Calditrichales bacterium]|nr:MAG: trypsin-like serine protease [Calditrichales bacterium]